jgi:S1-C subfamily serine protease
MTGGAVITAVNGQAVGSPDDLTRILARFRPGGTISRHLGEPVRAAHYQQPAPDRRTAAVTSRTGA